MRLPLPDEKVLNAMCPSHLTKDLRSTLRELRDWLTEKTHQRKNSFRLGLPGALWKIENNQIQAQGRQVAVYLYNIV